jgi:carbonic anhydrase
MQRTGPLRTQRMGPVLPERVWTLKTNWRPAARALVVAVFEPVESETIANQEESVLQDVRRIREHPLVPRNIPIYGYVYDVKSGRLKEVANI